MAAREVSSSTGDDRAVENAQLLRVDNPIREYAWGSPTAIPEALGTEPTGAPQAEMWLGSHPSAPSTFVSSGATLDSYLAQHPGLLGPAAQRFGSQLPFLMKLLAAETPLSLQVHPTQEQARAGFLREEAAGIPLDDPRRNYLDVHHKPEMIVAITPFEALCGFRPPAETRKALTQVLGAAASSATAQELLDALDLPDEAEALHTAFTLVLSGRDDVRTLAGELRRAAQHAAGSLAATVRFVGDSYGDDPGILGAALLNRIDLAPGAALFMDAGIIHAYLRGFGLEAMAPSDNVLRGGLTPKHVDVAELMRTVDFHSIIPTLVPATISARDGVRVASYRPPVAEFSVHFIDAEAGPRTLDDVTGPSMLIVVEGSLEARVGSESLILARGDSVFQAFGDELAVRALDGKATAYLTTLGG